MFKKFLLLLVFGLSCQSLLPVKIQTGSHNANHEFITDGGEFELNTTELNQLKSALIDGIIEDTGIIGRDTIPLPINKQTFALLKNILSDIPVFNAVRYSTVEVFLPLLHALSYLNTSNRVLLQVVAKHYFEIQRDFSLVFFAEHFPSIASFFQLDVAQKELSNASAPHTCLQTLTGHGGWVRSVTFSPDGQTLASGSADHTTKLWKLVNGQWQCTQTLNGHWHWVYSVAFSPDGQTLASGSGDTTIKLWKLVNDQWQCTQTLTVGDSVCSVAFSPDGQTLASGSGDAIKLWELANDQWQCTQTLTVGDSVCSVAFSPDGQTLASGSSDGIIKLWKLVNGQWQCTQTLNGHGHWVYSVAFSSDGQTLASGSSDGIIKLWKLVNDQWQCTQTLTEHRDQIKSVAFSSDGQTLASGSHDGIIKLWKLVNGQWQCTQTLNGHWHWVYSVAFSPDGQTLASGSFDNTIKLWAIALDYMQQLVLLWNAHHVHDFRTGISPCLDSIFNSLPEQLQQKIMTTTSV